jgi:hypothetical protein
MKPNRWWMVAALLAGLAAGCSGTSSPPAKPASPAKANDQKASAIRTGVENPPPP